VDRVDAIGGLAGLTAMSMGFNPEAGEKKNKSGGQNSKS
jgi:hypothetical protein